MTYSDGMTTNARPGQIIRVKLLGNTRRSTVEVMAPGNLEGTGIACGRVVSLSHPGDYRSGVVTFAESEPFEVVADA